MATATICKSFSLVLLTALALPVIAQDAPVPVTWVNARNVKVAGSTITETCGGCDDAGAESQQTLTSGDGGFEFVVGTKEIFAVGIGYGAPSTKADAIEFAFHFNGAGSAEIRENGRYLADTKYEAGDRFRIAVEGGAVNYYKNEGSNLRLVYSSKNPKVQYPLKVEAALLGPGTSVSQAVAKRRSDATAASPAPAGAATSKITWTNLVNATVNGSTLTGGSADQNSGAQSNETLTGDGYIEFTATETDKMRAIGLDSQNSDNTFQDIDFAIVLRQKGDGTAAANAEVWEGGTFISDMPYNTGDRFRIAIEKGVVKYYKTTNGKPVAMRGNNSTVKNFPLHVDAALYDPQSTIADVIGSRSN